jgi:hypothetical protein
MISSLTLFDGWINVQGKMHLALIFVWQQKQPGIKGKQFRSE